MATTRKTSRPSTRAPEEDFQPEETPHYKERSSVMPVFWLLVALLILGGYGWWMHHMGDNPFYQQSKPQAQDTPTPMVAPNADLQAEFEQLTKSNQQAFSEIEALTTRINLLTQALENREAAAPPTLASDAPATAPVHNEAMQTLQETVNILAAQVEELQQTQQTQASNHAATLHSLQVVDTIEALLTEGEAYAEPLDQLQGFTVSQGIETSALADLELHANSGIPTLSELIATFEESAQIAVPVSLQVKENPSFSEKLRARVGHVISIRKVGENSTAEGDEAFIARAEAALHKADIATALSQLEQLTPEAGLIFSQWKKQAQSYEKAWNALKRIQTAMYAPLTPTPAPAENKQE